MKALLVLATLLTLSATASASPSSDCQAVSAQFRLRRVTDATGQSKFMETLLAGKTLRNSFKARYGGEKVTHQKDGQIWGLFQYNQGHSFYLSPAKLVTCKFSR
jgi:hypothetical protein